MKSTASKTWIQGYTTRVPHPHTDVIKHVYSFNRPNILNTKLEWNQEEPFRPKSKSRRHRGVRSVQGTRTFRCRPPPPRRKTEVSH